MALPPEQKAAMNVELLRWVVNQGVAVAVAAIVLFSLSGDLRAMTSTLDGLRQEVSSMRTEIRAIMYGAPRRIGE